MASLALHGAGYVGLSSVELLSSGTHAPSRPSEMQWVTMDPLPSSEDVPEDREPQPTRALDEPPEQVPPPPEQAPPPQLIPTPQATPAAPQPPQPPPPPVRSLQAVEQTSDDPSVPPPPDAQYMAAENRRVDEETAATDTSLRSDTPTAEPPPPNGDPNDGRTADEAADDPEDTDGHAEAANAGEASGAATPSSASELGTTRTPAPATTASGGGRDTPPASSLGARASGATPAPTETVTIDDGFGTFTVERPRATTSGTPGDPRERRGDEGEDAHRGGTGPNLRIGFASFEGIYGADSLGAERAARRAEREAQAAASGSHRRERWEQFQFAAENFLPTVRPGNQTALNAAASPYATWVAAVHRRIHAQFAERFLARIGRQTGALEREDLYTELEFVVDTHGRVLRVSVAHTSGVSAFDLGAFNSVMDAQPFPIPPDAILSGDNRVYIIWGFSRGPSACHTMQARPFILPDPPPLVPMPGITLDDEPAPRAVRTTDEPPPLP